MYDTLIDCACSNRVKNSQDKRIKLVCGDRHLRRTVVSGERVVLRPREFLIDTLHVPITRRGRGSVVPGPLPRPTSPIAGRCVCSKDSMCSREVDMRRICAWSQLDPVAGEGLELDAIYQPVAVIEWQDRTGSHRKFLCDPKRRVFRRSHDALRIATGDGEALYRHYARKRM